MPHWRAKKLAATHSKWAAAEGDDLLKLHHFPRAVNEKTLPKFGNPAARAARARERTRRPPRSKRKVGIASYRVTLGCTGVSPRSRYFPDAKSAAKYYLKIVATPGLTFARVDELRARDPEWITVESVVAP